MSLLFWIIWIVILLTAFQESFNKHHSVKHLKGIDYKVDDYGKIVISLKNGVDLKDALELVAKKEKIKSGLVQGVGTIKDPELWSYDHQKKGFTKKQFRGVYQIVSASGNVSLKDGLPNLHIHVALNDNGSFNIFGGHLRGGVVGLSGEFFIVPTDISVSRVAYGGLPSVTEWRV